MNTQLLQPEGYSLPELAWQLARVRGKRVPKRTLQWWIAELGMEPNAYGLYDDGDLAILASLVLFLKRCRSLNKFKQLLLKEIESHAD